MSEKLNLRLLQRDELHKLKPFYRRNDSPINPSNQLLTAAVVELPDETIVGMLGFELIPHVGPIEILDPYKRMGLGTKLYQLIESQLGKNPHTGYYTFPSTDASKELVKKLGLIKMPWEVWKREY